MRGLSSYLFRVALLATLIAVMVILAVALGGDWISFQVFLNNLPADLRLEMTHGTGDFSPELSAAMNAHYMGWVNRAIPLAAVLVGLAVGGVVGMVHSRRLMRPLDGLAQAAERLAHGDMSVRADLAPSRIDEIDAFVRNFNTMAAAIERSERNLRESNAAIAHELRTPLTILNGRLNGMLDGVFPVDDDGLRLLLTQTDQLQRIITDLNLLTLAAAGRFELRAVPLDLADAVRAGLADQGVELALSPAPARADPARVRQILSALLHNARRYAGQGLRVETGTAEDGAFLAVMDRGPGLTPDQAERVFDRFWRAEGSRNKADGGSGLGLSVVRALAHAHGGDVRYHDRAGGGAVFRVTFPGA
ncbi:ATP-binding protein [Paracoccus sp. (in: a-proteobacteria)]|uniref:ATP-binding protein n=1 Tax=Paracoccus sp. TaxID=267 RepID=UPI0026E072DC|nr:ATP-binding protein [Paracoccus sp. (in: a-proteobacteria)]MDO5647251.1 ATP-binding protein [Paracoccus sp. (in: a-proteobacteria)]